ncbi:MAG: polyhydroxybutyrate depolymerase [Deltaproteobacteria bacterium]|nr:polyhydroxybutyrate depolymerase [Deltaproteobacteria bacterium]
MRRLVAPLVIALLCAVPAFAADFSSPGDHEGTLRFGGDERVFILHVPPGEPPPGGRALVVVLHGGAGNAAQIAKLTGFSHLADRENFLVLYPEGISARIKRLAVWNSGNCCGPALDRKIDDVGFLAALLDHVKTLTPCEERRVFMTGLSNGAMMAYRFACERADRVAAIAPVAGSMGAECAASRPVSLLVMHGPADKNVRYEGGTPEKQLDPHPRVDRSVADAKTYWSMQNRCTGAPTVTRKGNVETEIFSGCADGTRVVIVTLHGGGHTWPGGPRTWALGDAPVRDLGATTAIWEFFKSLSR